ncbi:uncharacterized protein LOC136075832 [Hydra vulgaris]|uniref:Uncharacterized protein LOC136075832 n=1 Tax=Hydra vulgaris TaxID=6087 RepID=A0ABM4B8Y6_HYDVU
MAPASRLFEPMALSTSIMELMFLEPIRCNFWWKVCKDGKIITYYQCNRSGFYKCLSSGKRRIQSSVHRPASKNQLKENTLVSLPPVILNDLESKINEGCDVRGDIHTLKINIIKNLMELVNLVTLSTISEEKALTNLNKNILQATGTFLSLSENKVGQFILKENLPSNKKLTKQPQFYSTKKRKKVSSIRLAKPSGDEIKELFDFSKWESKEKENESNKCTIEKSSASVESKLLLPGNLICLLLTWVYGIIFTSKVIIKYLL